MSTPETDTGITITLTADETVALGRAAAFYLEHCHKIGFNEQRYEIAQGLISFSKKIQPLVKQRAEEERNA